MSEIPFALGYAACRDLLARRLREPAPGRIQLLTGPRQVGKTTLLLDLARQWGDAAVYAAGDDPNSALPGFWDRARVRRGPESAFLSFEPPTGGRVRADRSSPAIFCCLPARPALAQFQRAVRRV
jgi:hypothetical protein